jgi:O-antigen/teichoic acid export membrane protein
MSQTIEPTPVLEIGWRDRSRVAHLRTVTTGTVLGTGIRVLAVAATSVLSFASAHILGASGTGELFLATTVAWTMAVVARLGLDSVVLRHIAVYRSLGNPAGMRGVARLGAGVVLCSGLAATAAIFLLAGWISKSLFHSPNLVATIRIVSFAIVPLALTILVGEMLRAVEQIVRSQLLQGVVIPLGTALGILLLGFRYGSTGAAAAYVAGCSVAALAGLIFWVGATPELRRVVPKYDIPQLARGGFYQFPYQCLVMILNWAPFISLGIFATTGDTGVFGIAWRLSLFLAIVPLALDSIAAPKIAALYATGDRSSLRWLCQTATLGLLVVTLPVAATFALFRSEIMALFGGAFEGGGVVLLPLVLLRLMMAAMGPVNVTLLMTGHERSLRNVLFVAAVASIMGNAVLIKVYGASGAAWASGGALALGSCLAAVSVRRHLGFWPFPQWRTAIADLRLMLRTRYKGFGR